MKFKPEDFDCIEVNLSERIADRANQLLEAEREKAVVVYQPANLPQHLRAWFNVKPTGPHFTARLVDIREVGE